MLFKYTRDATPIPPDICIITKYNYINYTYECKGYDFFSADPENLGGLHGERDIIDFVRKIYKMDADEYVEHCRKDHEELKRMYDIQIIGEKFMSFVNTKHMVFNSFERKVISFAKRFVN